MTDLDGNFMLPASKGQQLEISYVGFATKDVTVGDGPMEIRMSESTNNLDEVVVGYGTMKKKDLTGGLTVVGEEALKMSGSANLMDRLVGQVAGFRLPQARQNRAATRVCSSAAPTLCQAATLLWWFLTVYPMKAQ